MRPPGPDRPDFVDVTVARLRLTAQRRELAEATRWLADEHRELLALWWLEASGQLRRAEVVAALAEPADAVAQRIARIVSQLTVARITVRALGARPRCPYLGHIAVGWTGETTTLWQARFGRHIRDCERCRPAGDSLIEPALLLAGLPLIFPYGGAVTGCVPSSAAERVWRRPGEDRDDRVP